MFSEKRIWRQHFGTRDPVTQCRGRKKASPFLCSLGQGLSVQARRFRVQIPVLSLTNPFWGFLKQQECGFHEREAACHPPCPPETPGQRLPPEGSDSCHIRGWYVLGQGPHPRGCEQQRKPAVDTPCAEEARRLKLGEDWLSHLWVTSRVGGTLFRQASLVVSTVNFGTGLLGSIPGSTTS